MKKFRKSILAVILAGVMLMGLAVTSFAADNQLVALAYAYDGNGVCFDGLEFENGQSYTAYVPAYGWIDCYEETFGARKATVKIYDNGKLALTYDKNNEIVFNYSTSTPKYITIAISKNGKRIDCTTKEATAPATATTQQAAPATQTTPTMDVSTAAEAQQLADYYKALVKKNNLADDSAEAQLAAYYKSLAKKLK